MALAPSIFYFRELKRSREQPMQGYQKKYYSAGAGDFLKIHAVPDLAEAKANETTFALRNKELGIVANLAVTKKEQWGKDVLQYKNLRL